MKSYDELKKKLLGRQQELNDRVSRIKKDISKSHSNDWDDQAQERENDEVLDQLGKDSELELQGIQVALERMNDNKYGICATCSTEIPMERLQVKPHAIRCVNCAA